MASDSTSVRVVAESDPIAVGIAEVERVRALALDCDERAISIAVRLCDLEREAMQAARGRAALDREERATERNPGRAMNARVVVPTANHRKAEDAAIERLGAREIFD